MLTTDENQVVARMQEIIRRWEGVSDRRAVFLTCYMMMTENMLTAIARGEFDDAAWVDGLLRHFADYYFLALEAYARDRTSAPRVWQLAHDAALSPDPLPLQLLMLGVNAHINYDLVLALADRLAPEWAGLSAALRQSRYRDFCHVNAIIGGTIDAVQDQVLEPAMPGLALLDRLFGSFDEKLISKVITGWREGVWEHAVLLLDAGDEASRAELIAQVENTALRRCDLIAWRLGRKDGEPGQAEPLVAGPGPGADETQEM